MKITGYRFEKFSWPRRHATADANGVSESELAAAALIFIETDENITGLAPAKPNTSMEKFFRVIDGEDPRSTIGLWKRMNDHIFKNNNEGDDFKAISAIDAALWDLKAKIAGEPLWRFLGARDPRVKAYGSGLDLGLTDEEVAVYYQEFADLGVDAGKLKVGPDIDRDIERIQIMHDVLAQVSKRPHLMIDSNEYWSPKQSIRYISEIEEKFDLAWVEEPARRWDYRGLRQVSQAVRAAVSSGENINGLDEFYPLVHNEAIDIVQMHPNGVTVSMQIANFAYAYELPVTFNNSFGSVYAHVAAAMPNFMMQEVQVIDPPPCVTTDTHIEDGYIHVGNEPGFGITVDEAELTRLQEVPQITSPQGIHTRREGAGLVVMPPQPGEGFYGEK